MALDAGWDEEMLKVEIEALQAEDFDLGLTGFDEKELAGFFDTDEDAKEDDFRALLTYGISLSIGTSCISLVVFICHSSFSEPCASLSARPQCYPWQLAL